MGKRGPKPRRSEVQWSPHVAYGIGLLAADGCLSPDGRHIDFTSSEVELLENFKSALEIKAPIARRRSGYVRDRHIYRVQFSDARLYQFLHSIGFMPRKSKEICHVTVPNMYFNHFLRGYFDGDGSVYAFWDQRWRNSYMFYITFVSGSRAFLQWLERRIYSLCGVHGTIGRGGGAYQLRYAKAGSRAVAAYMYANEDEPRLERKFTKVSKIFNMDPSDTPR